jgi:hypothetical protein
MNLIALGKNQTEINLDGGLTVFFSYNTPVACRWHNGNGQFVHYVTARKWSRTTARHIHKWVGGIEGYPITIKPQEYFDNLLTERQYVEVNRDA